MPSVLHGIVSDPAFQKLSDEDQQSVLSRFEPDIGKLDVSEVPYVVTGLQKQALSRPDLADPAKYLAQPGTAPIPPELRGSPYGKVMVPAMGGGGIAMEVPQGEEQKFQQSYQAGQTQGGIAGLAGLGAAAAPELLVPGSTGAGLAGYATSILGRAALTGGGAALGTSTGQALTGQNPFAPGNLQQSLQGGAYTGALALPFEAVGQFPTTKQARAAVNLSLGAKARDVTYGNPAKGILDEGITSVPTGDFEVYKDTLRRGGTQDDAAQAAGGRIAAVNQRVNQIAAPLNAQLNTSNARIPVADVIDRPLNDAVNKIISNPAMTTVEKNAAIAHLGDWQQELHNTIGQGLTDLSPVQAQSIKQSIGDRVNWLSQSTELSDPLKAAYRNVYGSLKQSIHQAVPGTAPLDERLSNLLAARRDLMELTKREEVGAGTGAVSGKIGPSFLGRAEAATGKFPIPQMSAALSPTAKGFLGAVSQAPPDVQAAARRAAATAGILGYGIIGRKKLFGQ